MPQLSGEIAASKNQIDNFIHSHVTRQELDRRTEKAYRLDLEHFYAWAEQRQEEISLIQQPNQLREDSDVRTQINHDGEANDSLDVWMENYLEHLKKEKRLSASTICRKNRVLGYYLTYLEKEGAISGGRSLRTVQRYKPEPSEQETGIQESRPSRALLSRKEADAFFEAMSREYDQLNSEFRRRVCLRDRIMMELLFYHKIEISELLRIEVPDYDQKTGCLTIRRKRGRNYSIRLFSQELQRKLGMWLEEREHFRREGEYWDRMFLSKLGKPLSMEMMIQIFDKYRRLAGIEKELTPKDLKESSMKQYAKELVMERCS